MEGKILVKNPNGSSKAWEHFGFYKVGSKLLKDKAVCMICNQECKYTGGTTNLNQHLQKYHSHLMASTGPSTAGGKKSIQSQITSMMKKPIVKMPLNSPAYQDATESVAEFLCGDLVPISVVESKHFKGMLRVLSEGRYQPPRRKYFTDTLMEKMLINSSSEMKAEMSEISGIGLTTDSWTSCATEHYITYTAHYITNDWQLQCKVLSTDCSLEKLTAENLALDMKKTEEKWGLNSLLFSPVYVHDNASNVTKAPKLMETERISIGCLAHTLNLAAIAGTSMKRVSALIGKARGLVTTFKRSTSAAVILKKKQELLLPDKQHKLIIDCATRWNSSYDMLERLLEQSQAVTAAALDPSLKHLHLRENLFTADEEGIAEEVIAILKPMKKATTFVSAEKQPTVSKILPTLAKIRKEMAVNEGLDSELAAEMKTRIVENINKRYTDHTLTSFLLKACFLDPRYKSLNNIAKEGAVFVTKQAVRDMCIKVAQRNAELDSAATTASVASPSLPSLPASAAVKIEPPAEDTYSGPPAKKVKKESDEYDDWLNDVIYVGTEQGDKKATDIDMINKELERYDTEPQIQGNPLDWWKSREGSMPTLAQVAKSILCVPGSSVPSERVFSKTGQLVNKRRSSLKSKNVNKLVFLNKNYTYKHSSE